MGTATIAGVVGGFGALIVLAFAGPVWTVVWLALVIVLGASFGIYRTRRRDRAPMESRSTGAVVERGP
jgi:uncharacterized membrane protein